MSAGVLDGDGLSAALGGGRGIVPCTANLHGSMRDVWSPARTT